MNDKKNATPGQTNETGAKPIQKLKTLLKEKKKRRASPNGLLV